MRWEWGPFQGCFAPLALVVDGPQLRDPRPQLLLSASWVAWGRLWVWSRQPHGFEANVGRGDSRSLPLSSRLDSQPLGEGGCWYLSAVFCFAEGVSVWQGGRMGREKGRCKLSALLGSRVIVGAPQWADPFTLPSPTSARLPRAVPDLRAEMSPGHPECGRAPPAGSVSPHHGPCFGSFQAPGWLQFFTDWWECSQGKSSPQCWAWAAQFVVHQLSTLLAALALLWLPCG